MTIHYRSFRNPDPPALVQIWNESLTGRGAAYLQGTLPLEYYVLSKPYFDPQGLIVAEDDGLPVGFAHAGFGPTETGDRLAADAGVVCAVLVQPSYRGVGIGSQLLRRAEGYLRSKGAGAIYFGAMRPLNPFYLGLYGGSELPGVLSSEPEADGFLRANGYAVWDRCFVFNRSPVPVPVKDVRLLRVRQKYELHVAPRPVGQRWFEECLHAPLECWQCQLLDKATRQAAAQALVWEMDLFGWRWHQSAAGITDVEVREDLRRQGLGTFLLMQVLAYLHDQYFAQVEVQTMERNTPALNLYRSLGFDKVDEGRVYRLQQEL